MSDELTVGLVHSTRGATGFFGGVGDGLCLTGEENGCGKIYNNLGIDARYHFYRSGGITMAADGGLFARSFDPFALALKVGVTGRWQSGQLAVDLAPSIFAGLTERDPEGAVDVEVTSNKEVFLLPVTAITPSRRSWRGYRRPAGPVRETGDTGSSPCRSALSTCQRAELGRPGLHPAALAAVRRPGAGPRTIRWVGYALDGRLPP